MVHLPQNQVYSSNAKRYFFVGLFTCMLILPISGCTKDDGGNANMPPVADAGDDTRIEFPTELLLSGNASYDRDGNIAGWLWTQIDGPSESHIDSSTSSNTRVNNLMDGIYKFELKVTDNRGSASKDTITVNVDVSDSTFTFEIEYDWSRAVCILFHENVDSIIPAGKNFDVFYQSKFDGFESNWILLDEYPSSSTSYSIVNGDLEIYQPGIDCNFDASSYKARIVVY